MSRTPRTADRASADRIFRVAGDHRAMHAKLRDRSMKGECLSSVRGTLQRMIDLRAGDVNEQASADRY